TLVGSQSYTAWRSSDNPCRLIPTNNALVREDGPSREKGVAGNDRQHGKSGGKQQLHPNHGHHNGLQIRVLQFKDALLASNPPIEGFDETVFVEPARLHVTLGLMHLEKSNYANVANKKGIKTVQQALDLLSSLRPEIVKIVGATKASNTTGSAGSKAGGIPVNLDTMGTLNEDKNDTAHVLWIGPEARRGLQKTTLERVAAIVNDAFRREGFITETRPLKLHCTIIKTSQRRIKRPGERDTSRTRRSEQYGLSRRGIFKSKAYKDLNTTALKSPSLFNFTSTPQRSDFGTWSVDEIQLCLMGPTDPDTGAYTSVGGIKI
ncbi:5901_t:CDS:2, partial [Acaulospora colombiana]